MICEHEAPHPRGPVGDERSTAEAAQRPCHPRLSIQVFPSPSLFVPSGHVVFDQIADVTVAPMKSDPEQIGIR